MSDQQQLKNLLRECQELLPMSWHDCDDSECSNDLCERHRGHSYVSKRIDAIADLDGRIDDALAGHVTTDSGFREFGIILAEIEKAYEAIGAPKRDQDPDARDPAYIGDAVARAVRDLKFQGGMSDEQPIDQLIEGLTILKKYLKPGAFPTHCEHDELMVMVPSDAVMSDADLMRLDALGFHVSEEHGCWSSFRFGSA